jgi:hypothetical protein
MPKRKQHLQRKPKPSVHPRGTKLRRRKSDPPGPIARGPRKSLASHTVGALPIVNRVLGRMRLEEVLLAYLPQDDPRTKLPTVVARRLRIDTRAALQNRQWVECGRV